MGITKDDLPFQKMYDYFDNMEVSDETKAKIKQIVGDLMEKGMKQAIEYLKKFIEEALKELKK